MHGLRKTMGKLLAERKATTREIMDVLGHTDIQHAECTPARQNSGGLRGLE